MKLATIASALCIGLSGVLAGSGACAQTGKIKIIIPSAGATAFLPHYVAQDLGWFKKAGLEVEEVNVLGDSNAIRSLISGQGEIIGSGTSSTYLAIANGATLKGIGSWQPIADYQIVAQSRFNSLKELETATFAAATIGGMTTAVPQMMLRKQNLDASKMKFLVIGGHEARLQAVIAKKVDAATVSNLFASLGQKMSDVKLLGSVAREIPGLGYSYVVTTDAVLADAAKRARLETYIRYAVVEGSRFIMKNPAEAAKVLKGRVPDLDLAVVEAAVRSLNDDKVWGVNGGLDTAVTDFTIKVSMDIGELKTPLKAEQVIDRRVLDRVLAQTGRQ